MKPKLRFNGAVHYMYGQLKDHIIESFHHLTGGKFAKVAAFFGGAAGGVLSCHNTKISALGDELFYFFCLGLCFN